MDVANPVESLIALLDNVPASEFMLIIEAALIPMVSALAPYSTLTNHGVTALIPLTETSAKTKHASNALVFLTRPDPTSLMLIAQCALANSLSSLNVIVTPEIELSVSLLFTKYGVLGDIALHSWPLGFVADAIEPDLLQLYDAKSKNDPSKGIWPLVWALDWLQRRDTGAFGRVTAIGPTSRYVASLLKQKRAESFVKEQAVRASENLELDESKLETLENRAQYADYHFGYASSTFFGSSVEQVIIIDRDLDLVSPLLCQTTYQGVLSETIGLTSSGVTKKGIKASLKGDPLLKSLSQGGFAEACEYLHVSAKQLQEEYRLGNDISRQDTSIAEIRKVVNKLGSLQATQKLVDTHTELASVVMRELETGTRRDAFDLQMQILDNQLSNAQAVARTQDLIYRGASLNLVLRLLCLLCLVRDGIRENVLQALFYGDILKTYGYQALNKYHYLQSRGLIFPSKSSSFLLSTTSFTPFSRFSADSTSHSSSGSDPAATNRSVSSKKDPASLSEIPASQTYPWYTINKAYKLYPSKGDESKPYSGYVPLSARLVRLARGSLSKTLLEPEVTDEPFGSKDEASGKEAKLRRTLMRNSPNTNNKQIVMVVLVGGVTYAEVAAIKKAFYESSSDGRQLVVASNSVITGDDLVDDKSGNDAH